jgi:predicted DNA-binding protein (MmcQ/YjbR family)
MDIVQLRQYCLSLPKVTEDVKWEKNLCFSIGKKMFCIGSLDDKFSFSFKVMEEDYHELCIIEGIIPAPYLARYKWVLVQNPDCFSNKEWHGYIKQSYGLIKSSLPKWVQNKLSGK